VGILPPPFGRAGVGKKKGSLTAPSDHKPLIIHQKNTFNMKNVKFKLKTLKLTLFFFLSHPLSFHLFKLFSHPSPLLPPPFGRAGVGV
jgi:hypothetical protein